MVSHLKERVSQLEKENGQFKEKEKEYQKLIENEKNKYLQLTQTLQIKQNEERENQQKLIEYSSNYFSLKSKNELLEQRLVEIQQISLLLQQQNESFSKNLHGESEKNNSLTHQLQDSLLNLQNFFQISKNNFNKISNLLVSSSSSISSSPLEDQLQKMVEFSIDSQRIQSELFQQVVLLNQNLENQR